MNLFPRNSLIDRAASLVCRLAVHTAGGYTKAAAQLDLSPMTLRKLIRITDPESHGRWGKPVRKPTRRELFDLIHAIAAKPPGCPGKLAAKR